MERFRAWLFLAGFAVILAMPVMFRYLPEQYTLSGVGKTTTFPELSMEGIWDGSFQSDLDACYSEHYPGRDLMIMVRNQWLFSVFQKSPNTNIVMGKHQNLFEKEYIFRYLNLYPPVTSDEMEVLGRKLKLVQTKLEEMGKELYVFITPSKVRFYGEDVPDLYYRAALEGSESQGDYDCFVEMLDRFQIRVYDSIPFATAWKEQSELPAYYQSGIHWSLVLGMETANDFARYLNETSKFRFPTGEVTAFPVPDAIQPDADLFEVLNVFSRPYDEYFMYEYQADQAVGERPSLLCQGGSFLGQSLSGLINHGDFSSDIYISNKDVCRNRFSSMETIESFDELNIPEEIKNTDIVVLEVNEAHISRMSFGFLDAMIGQYQWTEE